MIYRKMVEAVVAASVALLKKDKPYERATLEVAYRNGVLDTVVAMLLLPGMKEKILFEKVKTAFAGVHQDWVHTKLAEERLVDVLLT